MTGSRFDRVPTRRLFKVVQGGTPTSDEKNWDGEVPWATPVDLAPKDGGFLIETARSITPTGLQGGSRAVPPDALILSTRAPIGYVTQTTRTTAFNQGCKGLVPIVDVDVRYFRYQLLSQAARLAALGQGATFMELSANALKQFPMSVPSPKQQRAIADFLDRETARIDALVGKKKRMINRLAERSGGQVESKIRERATQFGEQRLKFAVSSISVGIVITPAAWYSPAGVLALRGINVRPWDFDLSDVVYITPEGHALHRKSELSGGDVVVVRTGQAGAAAVVPPELEGSNCIDLLIIRPGEVVPDYLAYVLNSDWTTKHIAQHSVGTIQSHFNVGSLKDLPVPIPTARIQQQVVAELDQRLGDTRQITDRLRRQVNLLHEHRQALVTAAVMGQLEIPTAA